MDNSFNLTDSILLPSACQERKDKAFLLNKLQNLQKERREMASYIPQVLVLMCSVCSASSLHLVVISKMLYSTERETYCNCGDFSPTNTRIGHLPSEDYCQGLCLQTPQPLNRQQARLMYLTCYDGL